MVSVSDPLLVKNHYRLARSLPGGHQSALDMTYITGSRLIRACSKHATSAISLSERASSLNEASLLCRDILHGLPRPENLNALMPDHVPSLGGMLVRKPLVPSKPP